jgi:hypothetical protein
MDVFFLAYEWWPVDYDGRAEQRRNANGHQVLGLAGILGLALLRLPDCFGG